jgi:hypothetical protein
VPQPSYVAPSAPINYSFFDLISGRDKLSNNVVNIKHNPVKINIVILIYTYGIHTARYNITEKIFMHYKNIQFIFKNYAKFSFTIVGSELSVSRNLTLKYFPSDDYYEFPQETLSHKHVYEITTEKVNFGMRIAYARDDTDIIFWAGSNDYIGLSFWKQVIEDYDPKIMKLYGIDNFHNGRNAVFFTRYDGKKVTNWGEPDVFFVTGQDSFTRSKYLYIGGALGITRNALVEYPDILDYWNCDEGANEYYILHETYNASNSSSKKFIHKFDSKEVLFMNIKVNRNQDATSAKYLSELNKACNYIIGESNMSRAFMRNFKQEFLYFDESCSLN